MARDGQGRGRGAAGRSRGGAAFLTVVPVSAIPVLETARLRLREHRADDLDAYAAMWADADIVRFIGGVPLTREQAWARILQYRGMWLLLGYGFWVVEERDTGRLIGEAGVQDMRRDIRPTLTGMLECGWALVPAAQGRGLAREAVEAVLAWAARAHPALPLACIIAPANTPSLALAEKLGFTRRETAIYRGNDILFCARN